MSVTAKPHAVLVAVLGLVLGLAWIGASPPEQAAAAPAVRYGGSTSVTRTKATRSVALAPPARMAVGDVLVASFTASGSAKVGGAPVGWTSLLPERLRAGRGASLFAYVRVVSAADLRTSRWSWTLDRRRTWSGGSARYEGVDPLHPVDTKVSVASSGSPRSRLAVPGVRTTTSGTMLIGSVGGAAARSGVTPPRGWAEAWEVRRGPTAEHAHRAGGAAGRVPGPVWKVGSARHLAGWVTALRPDTGSTPPPDPSTTVPPPTPVVPTA
ncbi:MAG TPA: hypothetical protein VGD39_13975, partial [Nocardioides sp.]